MKGKIILIGGPTASGKSDFAISISSIFPVEIVNFDSVQVYKYMDIGTAKPSKEIRETIPHHLYDVRFPDQDFSAADFVREASGVIGEIRRRGNIPLLVGGTGLYARALLYGLDELPTSKTVRDYLRERAEQEGIEALWEELKRKDPAFASSISKKDTHRIVRGLEIIRLTGKTYSEQRRKWREGKRTYDALYIVATRERSELYRRIDMRAETMVKSGLIEEVKALLDMGYSPDLKPLRSHGYRQMIEYVSGRRTLDQALEEMKKETRNYAKRQITWFRREDARWVDWREREKVVNMIRSFLV